MQVYLNYLLKQPSRWLGYHSSSCHVRVFAMHGIKLLHIVYLFFCVHKHQANCKFFSWSFSSDAWLFWHNSEYEEDYWTPRC